jgi:hypothetical protein
MRAVTLLVAMLSLRTVDANLAAVGRVVAGAFSQRATTSATSNVRLCPSHPLLTQ